MKYRLCDWEDNGYHDSYFYGAYYDTEDGTCKSEMIGSTAFSGGCYTAPWEDPTPEIVEKARVWLEQKIFEEIKAAEYRDVLTPDNLNVYDKVRFTQQKKTKVKVQEECSKCGGSGEFPLKNGRTGMCWACSGTGKVNTQELVKDENGKPVWNITPKGTKGEVIWVGTFRTIYKKGYLKRDRNTLSCGVKLEDGSVVYCPMKVLRLDQEPMSDEELKRRAHKLSYNYQFGAVLGCSAWLSDNYAKKVMDSV